MDESRFYILGAKQLTGNISRAEILELNQIIIRNPGFSELYGELEKNLAVEHNSVTVADESVLLLLREKISDLDHAETPQYLLNEQSPPKHRRKFWRTIIAVCFLIGAASLVYTSSLFRPAEKLAEYKGNDIITKPGSKTQLRLPDGTRVILNADSKISYPDNFLGNTREVTLEGEAFFEVTEDKSKPFIIHSKLMDIKVVGTVFNVRAYPSEIKSEASLISGSIEVVLKNRTEGKVFLKPKEKLVVSEPVSSVNNGNKTPAADQVTASLVSIEKIIPDDADDAIDEIAWTDNKLVFHEEPFSSLAVKLERWYGKTIEIRSQHLLNTKFTGKFYNENIGQVLNALQKMAEFKYSYQKNEIIIW
jgi:transmembrane sensor